MATNKVDTVYGEEELFSYLQWLRLFRAKEINDQNLAENKQIEGQGFKNFRKKIKSALCGYDNKNTNIEKELMAYNGSGHAFRDEEGAKMALVRLFIEDTTKGIPKLLFAVKVALDNEFNYEYEKEGLKEASIFLFNDANKLQDIKEELEENYKAIADKPFSTLQKTTLATVIVTSLAAAIVVPSITGKALALGATGGLSMTLRSAGFATLAGLITTSKAISIGLAAAIIGGTYISMREHNKKAIRESFRNTSIEDHNSYLAVQCLIINHLRNTLNDHDFKEELDKILKSLNSFKSDLDYYLFVEKEDIDKNEEKINSFHNFDSRLSTILL